MRPLAPLELWLLAHRPSDLRTSITPPLPFAGKSRPPLTQAELWDKLVAESGLERMRVEAMAA